MVSTMPGREVPGETRLTRGPAAAKSTAICRASPTVAALEAKQVADPLVPLRLAVLAVNRVLPPPWWCTCNRTTLALRKVLVRLTSMK